VVPSFAYVSDGRIHVVFSKRSEQIDAKPGPDTYTATTT
jgi:hypothetical protein